MIRARFNADRIGPVAVHVHLTSYEETPDVNVFTQSTVSIRVSHEEVVKMIHQLDAALPEDRRQCNPSVVQEVAMERQRQFMKFGHTAAKDDENTMRDWVAFITYYMGPIVNWRPNAVPSAARTAFIKIAALAVAAVEAIDRRDRLSRPPNGISALEIRDRVQEAR